MFDRVLNTPLQDSNNSLDFKTKSRNQMHLRRLTVNPPEIIVTAISKSCCKTVKHAQSIERQRSKQLDFLTIKQA